MLNIPVIQKLVTASLRHVLGLSNNPTCRKCGTEEETSVHILCECEALASLWAPSFWNLRTLGKKLWGPSGTLLKEQGSYSLVQNMGHKGPVLRSRCIRSRRARTQILFYSRKDGARPALFLIFVLFYVFFVLFYIYLCCSMYFLCSIYICVVLCTVCFVTFSVLFVCICVLNYCHRVATQLQLNIISYHISYHIIISCHVISYHVTSCRVVSCRIVSYCIIYHICISYCIVSYHIISYIISRHVL